MSKWLVLIIGSLLSLALNAQEIEFSRADIQAELEKRLLLLISKVLSL